jgi:RNA polymerase sigma factor (TIGR02999 family)
MGVVFVGGGSVTEITRILSAITEGNAQAAEQLLPLVYDELRSLAALRMVREAPGQTLEPTALVHEAYVRLVDKDHPQQWNSRGHFFAAAAEAMRRILVERARHKQAVKAGGDHRRQRLGDIAAAHGEAELDILALHEALTQLENEDPRRAAVVKLRFFAGLTIDETAQALGISASTADNDWAYARSWLRLALEGDSAGEPG